MSSGSQHEDASDTAPSAFTAALQRHGLGPLRREPVTVLQVNLGKRCNMACRHCHVGAGPTRSEMMDRAIAERVVALLDASPGVTTVDITGGAPELNPNFRWLVQQARRRGLQVLDRCNLTVLLEPGMEDLADFLAAHQVEVVASLPCYLAENVDQQRGRGAFERSIRALRLLNRLGYGLPGSNLRLGLVYNPGGPSLPPSQAGLEEAYRQQLGERFGLSFSYLLTITNMPIARFADDLARAGRDVEYMNLLVGSFNPATVPGLMCRSLVSVDWRGRLFDCDFNQMLELGAPTAGTIHDIDSLDAFEGQPVATGPHCFGCTAGAGSSCSGALD